MAWSQVCQTELLNNQLYFCPDINRSQCVMQKLCAPGFTFTTLYPIIMGGMVALLVGHWTSNSQVTGSSPGLAPLHTGLGRATYTCVPPSPSSIIWYRPNSGYVLQLGTWEGNCRSGVTLATHHRFSGISTYGPMAQGREMNILLTLQQRGIAQFTNYTRDTWNYLPLPSL